MYAFVSPDKPDTTTIVANWIPFEEPAGGPNFFQFAEDAQYDLHIDSDGDAQDDLLFRYTFKTHTKNKKTFLYNTGAVDSLYDPDLNITQTYDIELIKLKNQRTVSKTKIADDVPVAPSNVGKASMPNYKTLRDQAIHKLTNGSTTFAGQADDPFFLDLRVFDLLYGGNLSEVGNDTLKGYNVNTLALQVPTHMIVESAKQPIVGIWSTTQRENAERHYSQVSRLGKPLVNEVVNPIRDKDKFNASAPLGGRPVPEERHQPRAAEAHRGDLQDRAPAGAAQRPRRRLPQGCRRAQPAAARDPGRGTAPQHLDRPPAEPQAARCPGR